MFSPFIDHVTCGRRVRLIPRVRRGIAGGKGEIVGDSRAVRYVVRG